MAIIKILEPIKLSEDGTGALKLNILDALNAADNPSSNNEYVVASDLNSKLDNSVLIRQETGTFIVGVDDGNKYIRYTGATDITVTVPNSILTGQTITLWQAGAGKITLVGDTGVILNGNLSTAGQYTAMQIIKVADNLFDVIGGVA